MATAGQQTPIVRKLIDFFARRKVQNALRLPDTLSARWEWNEGPEWFERTFDTGVICVEVSLGKTLQSPALYWTQPKPILPDGPSHKLSANYYYGRDGRRDNNPPLVVFTGQKSISGQTSDSKPKIAIPGFGYDYGKGEGAYKS